MSRPDGITKKTKNNDHKHPQQREEWIKNKRSNRPQQRFNEATKTWIKNDGRS